MMRNIIKWCECNNKKCTGYEDGTYKVRLNEFINVEFYQSSKSRIRVLVRINGKLKNDFHVKSQKELINRFNKMITKTVK